MFQQLAAMEDSCAVIENVSHLLAVVMGFKSALMMRLDVVSYTIIESYNDCCNCSLYLAEQLNYHCSMNSVIIFQLLAEVEHSGATMDNASRAADVVMGDNTAGMAVMSLDVVSYNCDKHPTCNLCSLFSLSMKLLSAIADLLEVFLGQPN